jgi:DNA-binding SARP family transcriptional activator
VDLRPIARVALLDGFAVEVDVGGRPSSVGELPRAVQRLIAHLGLSGCRARSAIAGQLWPEVPEEHAQGSLRSALWRLHKSAPGLVVATGSTLSLAEGVRLDVRELTDWAQHVLDPLTVVLSGVTPEVGPGGELLPGWYEDWVLVEREQLRQLRMHALEALAGKLTDAGRYGEAVQAAYAAVRADPLRESAHRAVVQVHVAEGNVAEALRAYELTRRLLSEELGVVPTPRMEALVLGLQPTRRLRA